MARARLAFCSPSIRGKALEQARSVGSVTILTAAGGAATVYSDSTGTGTLTSTAVAFNPVLDALDGWVEPAEYQVSVGGVTQPVDVTAGDGLSGSAVQDPLTTPSLAAMNFSPLQRNSLAATTTSQTVKLVRIVPGTEITAAKVVSASGSTAVAATITKTVVGIYSTDGTTLTKLTESTTNLTSGLWDSANTAYRQALNPATVKLSAGTVYYVAMLVDATTAGNHQGYAKATSIVDPASTEVPVPMYTKATETTLAATYTIAALTSAFTLIPWVAVTA